MSVSQNPTTEQRAGDADRQLSEHARVDDVCDPGGRLAQEVLLARRGRRLSEPKCDERRSRPEERRGVDERHDVTPERDEEAGADDRRKDPESLAHGLEEAVRLAELLVREHRPQHRGARRPEDVAAEPVQQCDGVEDPEIRAVVHEQEQAHRRREREMRHDHQPPLRQPVDDDPAERRYEPGHAEEEEDDPGLRIRPGEDPRPDAERDEHRPVAEHRQELAGEEEADVRAAEDGAHASYAARKTRTSPLIVLPRTTTVGPVDSPPETGSLPSGTSEERSPEVDPASTSRSEPSATPISMSPDTLVKRDLAGGDRIEADVAGHGLRLDRAADGADAHVPGNALEGELSADARELGVAAHRLDARVAGDLAAHADVSRHSVGVQRSDPAVDARVRRDGLDLDARAVGDGSPHLELAVPHEAERGDREAELRLAAECDDDAVAVLTDLDLGEEPLVAVDGDARLLALDRLDLDIAGGNDDLEIERKRSVERLLEHPQTFRMARLIRMRISLWGVIGRRSGRSRLRVVVS